MKVLFVCLGNICRSPLAEAIFVQKIGEKNLEDEISADSCGTAAYHIGESPDPRTIEVAQKNNVSIRHRCRQLNEKDFETFDHILVMDDSNLEDTRLVEPPGSRSKISLLRDYDPEPGNGQVPDPYWGGEKDFQQVFDILERSISGFIKAETKY